VPTRADELGAAVREIEHTADVGIEVEAPSLPVLFERAGLAMLGLMVDLNGVVARDARPFEVTASDGEALLHDWLHVLLVALQARRFVACELAVEAIDATTLRAVARGEPLDPARHRVHGEIKGVTWHALALRERPDGWWARVIFDV
jgi:SHS2 domain-containing protein